MTITISDFQTSGKFNRFGDELGTCLVDGKPTKARKIVDGAIAGYIYIHGFVGRYQTRNKPWIADLVMDNTGRVTAYFGRDDRSSRFNKMRGISYEPELFQAMCNPKCWEPA